MASSQDRIINRVTVILGISELLLTETPGSLSERQEQLLRDLSRAARELSTMVRPQPEEC